MSTPISLITIIAFICYSAYNGHASIGMTCHKLSNTKFHPQCITNPTTAMCASRPSSGTPDGHTNPFSLVLSKNPFGNTFLRSASLGIKVLSLDSILNTHKNLCPLLSIPKAISFTTFLSKHPCFHNTRTPLTSPAVHPTI
ncbi:hypothetical protein IHE45_01G031800 [Dioscorea alata]|uniref:Uncharacterized protein n=1 Tax=Dioscorea alata TaxID=55571 RepID=A0ACB7WU65_DIOAL|nr:hypothetical protein IHE45_01G031800 [Dioscorea alata]